MPAAPPPFGGSPRAAIATPMPCLRGNQSRSWHERKCLCDALPTACVTRVTPPLRELLTQRGATEARYLTRIGGLDCHGTAKDEVRSEKERKGSHRKNLKRL